MKKIVGKFVILASLCLTSYVEGYSAKGIGMGNTGVAYPQDSLSSAYNPANSAMVGDRYDSIAGATYSPGSATIRNNPVPTADTTNYNRRTWSPVFAMGLNKQVTENISAGLIVYSRFFKRTYYNNSNVLVGETKIHHAYERYAASLIGAYNICDRVQLGITLDVNVGHHKVGGTQNFDNPALTVAPGHVTNRGYDWNWGLGTTVGLLWEVTSDLKLGVSFRPETKMSRFHQYTGFIPERGILHSPQEVWGGVSFRVIPCLTLAVDVQYIWANRLRGAHNPIIVLDPTVEKLGSKTGSAFGLSSEFVLHAGVDYAVVDNLILRAGYIYKRPIERKSQAFFDIIYNIPMKDYITVGATYQFCSVDLDFFYLHGFDRKITGKNAIPPYLMGGDAIHRRSQDTFGIGLGWLF